MPGGIYRKARKFKPFGELAIEIKNIDFNPARYR